MTVYRIDPLYDPGWQQFTAIHPLATVFHSTAWLNALKQTYGFEAFALTTSPPSAAIESGFVFCRVSSWLTGRRLVSLPFSDHCDLLTSSPDHQIQLLSALIEHCKEAGVKYAELRPVNSVPTSEENFKKTKEFVLHTLDLRPSIEDLFRSFHKDSVQRKIRRAEREGLSLDEGRSERLLQAFFRLLLITRRRHGLPPPPRTWFRNLIDSFGDQLIIRVANKDGNPIAAVLTLRFRDTLVYKYGASDITFHALGGMHALLWTAIKAAKNQGLRQVDLGRSDIEDQGLITFKDRWGTARSTINYFRYPFKLSGVSSSTAWAGRSGRRLFEWMPNAILSTAGKLLYRHVG